MSRRRLVTTASGLNAGAFGWLDWLLMAGTGLMWGSSFLLIAESLESLAPAAVTLIRLGLGALALGVIRGARNKVDREDLPRIALLGVVWMAVPLLLFPIAQQWVDSSIAGMVNGGVPLFAAVIAAVLLRRLPGRAQTVGLLVGFLGVLLITLPSATDTDGSPLGVGLIVVATALYGLAVNLSVPLTQRYGALPVLWRAQLTAIIVTLPFGVAGLTESRWAWSSAISMLILGVVSTGLAFVAMAELGKRVGPTRGAVGIYFIPVVAMILGVVFRDESVASVAVVGTGLVLVGAWLSSRREA
ncbi:MAG: DMT family transporter [Acidimicrobiia bacterium]